MRPDAQRLTILHTNDIHSHFGMMSPLAAMIAGERERAGDEPLLLLDIGDHMDRAAVETEGTLGQANIDILNLTGYDAVTLGNNEGLTFPPETLAAVYSGLLCPAVCCNLVDSATGAPPEWMQPSAVLERGGIRIGITGATAPFKAYYALLGWDALDPEPALREQCERLAATCDLVIVLSHLGIAADRVLAESLEGVDAILGGHTHHLLEEPLLINGTAVCGAGKFGRYLGRLVFGRPAPGQRFKLLKGECLPVDPALKEAVVEPAARLHLKRGTEVLEETVAITDRELPLDTAADSPFANLLAQAVRRFTGSELSLVNSGQLLGPLPGGEITAGMLHALCPSPINPCIMQLSGRNIRTALEQSLRPEFTGKPIYGYGFRGVVLGSLAVDGLTAAVAGGGRGEAPRLLDLYVGDEPLVDERMYTVGTLDMFTFGTGYESIADGTDIVFLLPHFLRDLLRMELKRPGSLDECGVPRLIPVPE